MIGAPPRSYQVKFTATVSQDLEEVPDEDLTFRWDFNNDGRADSQEASPTVTIDWTNAYKGPAKVVVKKKDGSAQGSDEFELDFFRESGYFVTPDCFVLDRPTCFRVKFDWRATEIAADDPRTGETVCGAITAEISGGYKGIIGVGVTLDAICRAVDRFFRNEADAARDKGDCLLMHIGPQPRLPQNILEPYRDGFCQPPVPLGSR